MVLAGKVFNVRGKIELDTIVAKLKGYQVEKAFEYENRSIMLLTEIKDFTITERSVQCTLSQDQVFNIYHRGQLIPTPKTIEAPIVFIQNKESLMLIVLEKKQLANSIANLLSKILFITTGNIVESRIKSSTLKNFHEINYEDTKVIFFDDVDVPSISKLSLYGSELANTSLYAEYLTHGNIWYVVTKSKEYGYVIGLTRNSVVTAFSQVGKPEFLDYIIKEILPLVTRDMSE